MLVLFFSLWARTSSGLAVAVVAGGGTVVVRTLGDALGASAMVDAPATGAGTQERQSKNRKDGNLFHTSLQDRLYIYTRS